MAVTDRYKGNAWYGRWVTSSGTVTLSGDQTTFSVDRSADMVDITAANEASKAYLASLKDSKFGYTRYDTGNNGSAVAAALVEGTSGTLTWGPQGSATGSAKFAVAAVVESHKVEYPYSDKVMLEIGFQGSGAFVSDYGATF
jgi:predicted transcriptional regulator